MDKKTTWRNMQARADWRDLCEGRDYEVADAERDDAIVNVIMLTYNHAPYIRHAIESVLMQKTQYPYRLVIADDCSTDGTSEIVREYQKKNPDRIAVIHWKRNVGMFCSTITVFHRFNAKYVAFLEGDDFWTSPRKLERALSFLESHPDYIGYTHNTVQVDADEHMWHNLRVINMSYPIRENQLFCRQGVLNKHPRLLAGHISALVHRNFQAQWDDAIWDTWQASCEGGDIKRALCLGVQGDVFHAREVMSAYRRRVEGESWTALVGQTNRCLQEYYMRRDLAKFAREVFSVNFPALGGLENSFLTRSQETIWGDFSLKNLGIYIRLSCLVAVRRLREIGRRRGE